MKLVVGAYGMTLKNHYADEENLGKLRYSELHSLETEVGTFSF